MPALSQEDEQILPAEKEPFTVTVREDFSDAPGDTPNDKHSFKQSDTLFVTRMDAERECPEARDESGFVRWFCSEIVDGVEGKKAWCPARLLSYDQNEMRIAKQFAARESRRPEKATAQEK